jgi:hypothetical protein
MKMSEKDILRLHEIAITIQQLKAETRLILLNDMDRTLAERQARAEEIYKANYPQWLKDDYNANNKVAS